MANKIQFFSSHSILLKSLSQNFVIIYYIFFCRYLFFTANKVRDLKNEHITYIMRDTSVYVEWVFRSIFLSRLRKRENGLELFVLYGIVDILLTYSLRPRKIFPFSLAKMSHYGHRT